MGLINFNTDNPLKSFAINEILLANKNVCMKKEGENVNVIRDIKG